MQHAIFANNSTGITMSTVIRLFDSISRLGGMFRYLEPRAGSNLGDVIVRSCPVPYCWGYSASLAYA